MKTTKDGPAVDVQINNETAWLNQNQMIYLFEKDQSVISRHLNNIFKEKETFVKLIVNLINQRNG